MRIKSLRLILILTLTLVSGSLGTSIAQAQAEAPLIPMSQAAPLPAYMKGVNLSGAEYAPGPNGVFGTNYTDPTTAGIRLL